MTSPFSTGKAAYCVVGEGYSCSVFGCHAAATTRPYDGTWNGAAFCDDHWLPEDVRVRKANLDNYNREMAWEPSAPEARGDD